jgi:hypothetical protein
MRKNMDKIEGSLSEGKTRHHFLRLFRRESESQAFLMSPERKSASSSTFNSESLRMVDQRKLEVEATKATLIAQSRHHDWKAGGAI